MIVVFIHFANIVFLLLKMAVSITLPLPVFGRFVAIVASGSIALCFSTIFNTTTVLEYTVNNSTSQKVPARYCFGMMSLRERKTMYNYRTFVMLVKLNVRCY